MKGKLFHGNNKRCRKKGRCFDCYSFYYLNRTKPVSKELGARIQNAVDELGYSLNLNAKILKTAQYMDIGVILPSLNDSYYVQLFQGIKTYFQNTNYFINLVFSNNIPELEVTIAQNFETETNMRVDFSFMSAGKLEILLR